jgi:hypothetical protein
MVMKCNAIRENLLDLVQNEHLDAATETHFRECADCRKEYESLRATMLALDAWEAPEPSPYFDQKLAVRLREVKAEESNRVSIWQTLLGYARKPAMGIGVAALMIAGVLTYNSGQKAPEIPQRVEVQVPGNTQPPVQMAGNNNSAVEDLQALAEEQDLVSDFDLLDEIHTDKTVANF